LISPILLFIYSSPASTHALLFNHRLLDDILAICAYIGAIRAKQRGFHAVVPLLYETAKHHAVQRVTQFPEEASMYVLSYELGVYLTSVDPTAAHNMLSEVAGAPTASVRKAGRVLCCCMLLLLLLRSLFLRVVLVASAC
jgi:hypothetical protein